MTDQQHLAQYRANLAGKSLTDLERMDTDLMQRSMTAPLHEREALFSERLEVAQRIEELNPSPFDDLGFTRMDQPGSLSDDARITVAHTETVMAARGAMDAAHQTVMDLRSQEADTTRAQAEFNRRKKIHDDLAEQSPVHDRQAAQRGARQKAIDLESLANNLEAQQSPELQGQVKSLRAQANEQRQLGNPE